MSATSKPLDILGFILEVRMVRAVVANGVQHFGTEGKEAHGDLLVATDL